MPSEFTPPNRRVNSGRGHRYVDAYGRKVPGVTTVIGNGVPKPALVGWAARTTAAYAIDYWDELAELPVSERITRLEKARFGERDELHFLLVDGAGKDLEQFLIDGHGGENISVRR